MKLLSNLGKIGLALGLYAITGCATPVSQRDRSGDFIRTVNEYCFADVDGDGEKDLVFYTQDTDLFEDARENVSVYLSGQLEGVPYKNEVRLTAGDDGKYYNERRDSSGSIGIGLSLEDKKPFSASSWEGRRWDLRHEGIDVFDENGDGKADIVFWEYVHLKDKGPVRQVRYVAVLHGTGDGNFPPEPKKISRTEDARDFERRISDFEKLKSR